MNKPFKVLSTTSLAAVMAVSAITPVAAAPAESPESFKAIENIMLTVDGKVVNVNYDGFKEVKRAQKEWALNAKLEYIQTSEGEIYSYSDYKEAKRASKGSPEEAIEILRNNNKELTPTFVEGEIAKDGSLIIKDEQPEDRLNETFFYNVA